MWGKITISNGVCSRSRLRAVCTCGWTSCLGVSPCRLAAILHSNHGRDCTNYIYRNCTGRTTTEGELWKLITTTKDIVLCTHCGKRFTFGWIWLTVRRLYRLASLKMAAILVADFSNAFSSMKNAAFWFKCYQSWFQDLGEILVTNFKLIVVIGGYEIALRWMLLDLTDKSTWAQIMMVWCHQATCHYLDQYWPCTRPQWVKLCPIPRIMR